MWRNCLARNDYGFMVDTWGTKTISNKVVRHCNVSPGENYERTVRVNVQIPFKSDRSTHHFDHHFFQQICITGTAVMDPDTSEIILM